MCKSNGSSGVSSVLVKDSNTGSINGIVTERDILYRGVAKNLGMFKVSIDNIMSSPILTIDKGKLSVESIRIMRTNHIWRLPVVDNGKVIGIVSLMSLLGNVPVRNIELAQLEVPESDSSVACPYDGSKFRDKNELSKHIDRVHLGSGLLEGDVRKFEILALAHRAEPVKRNSRIKIKFCIFSIIFNLTTR